MFQFDFWFLFSLCVWVCVSVVAVYFGFCIFGSVVHKYSQFSLFLLHVQMLPIWVLVTVPILPFSYRNQADSNINFDCRLCGHTKNWLHSPFDCSVLSLSFSLRAEVRCDPRVRLSLTETPPFGPCSVSYFICFNYRITYANGDK